MCYDIKASLEAQLKRAKRKNDKAIIAEIEKTLIPYTDLPLFHVSGFQHPKLLIYTERSPFYPEISTWGLVPHWIKNKVQLKKFWNQTLNARGESIFEKPAFRDSAVHNRCIIYVDGFYENHHFKNKTFPYHIVPKNNDSLALAGLYSEWTDTETGEILNTFSIVTTKGNSLLAKIHNNPKLEGPRMPLILPKELEDLWLKPIKDELDKKAIMELIKSYPSEMLDSFTVQKLRGKNYLGNVPEVCNPFKYTELENSADLFS